jgi:hypothetical protein
MYLQIFLIFLFFTLPPSQVTLPESLSQLVSCEVFHEILSHGINHKCGFFHVHAMFKAESTFY